uniref:Uncharacterized protein n=1 Tax=Oryza nivara TaxID=4536 RepID=A0A0E0HMG3_ORYNI
MPQPKCPTERKKADHLQLIPCGAPAGSCRGGGGSCRITMCTKIDSRCKTNTLSGKDVDSKNNTETMFEFIYQ